MTTEINLQNEIRLALNPYAVTFRANVGMWTTKDGRLIHSGLPVGFPDLFGFRKADGKMFFLEIKTNKGKLSNNQIKFSEAIQKYDVIYGVCRSTETAIKLITEE